ncbi:Pycsar system effector family protein [Halococcus thailandensis]|uniref:Pycsar system effector family protein n=1 Tax=Halococcus thailandensis TaxID=335952 RepID=UPI0012697D3E|nr:Pycsar system effector family protein [Halococcus thailandensis]
MNQYISLADNKASILLTAQFAFLGLSANALNNLTFQSSVVLGSAFLSGIFGIVSIFLSGWVVYPRTPTPQKGVIFWENIVAHESAEAFLEDIRGLDKGDVQEHLVRENYNLATVAHNKYRFLRWSLRGTAGMLTFAVISGGAYLLCN